MFLLFTQTSGFCPMRSSMLYSCHFISFASSILALFFLARCKDSIPYNYAVLFVWAIALFVTTGSAATIIIDHSKQCEECIDCTFHLNQHDSFKEHGKQKFEGVDAIEGWHFWPGKIQRRGMDIVFAALFTVIFSAVFILSGLRFGLVINQALPFISFLCSAFVMYWIYAGIAEIFPHSPKQHRYSLYCGMKNNALLDPISLAGIIIFCIYLFLDASKVSGVKNSQAFPR
jgi:hypothetical protein